jgi:very-short-patch-repair endonuclease
MTNPLFNRRESIERRRDLRHNATTPEKQLWQALRGAQLGVRFRRQQGIGAYIADFYCASKQLVIEVDGDSHFTTEGLAYDAIRTQFFAACGLRELRFSNSDVMQNLDAVVQVIVTEMAHPPSQ